MANSTKNLVVVNWQQSVSLQDCRELANGTASDNVAAVHNVLAAGVGAHCRFASVRACNVLICINITMNVCVCVCVNVCVCACVCVCVCVSACVCASVCL